MSEVNSVKTNQATTVVSPNVSEPKKPAAKAEEPAVIGTQFQSSVNELAVRSSISTVNTGDMFDSFLKASNINEKLELAVYLLSSEHSGEVKAYLEQLVKKPEGKQALRLFVEDMTVEKRDFYLRRVLGASYRVEELVAIIKKETEISNRSGDIKDLEKKLGVSLAVVTELISSIANRKEINISMLELVKIALLEKLSYADANKISSLLSKYAKGESISVEDMRNVVTKALEVIKNDKSLSESCKMIVVILEKYLDKKTTYNDFASLVKSSLGENIKVGESSFALIEGALKCVVAEYGLYDASSFSVIMNQLLSSLNEKGIVDISYKLKFPFNKSYSFIDEAIKVDNSLSTIPDINRFRVASDVNTEKLQASVYDDLMRIFSDKQKEVLNINGGILLRNNAQHQQIAIIDQVTALNVLIEVRGSNKLTEEQNKQVDGLIDKLLIGIGLMHDKTKIFPGSRYFYDGILRTREAKDRNSATDANFLLTKAYLSLYRIRREEKYLTAAKKYMDEIRFHGFANIFDGNVQRLLVKVSPDIEDLDDSRTFGFNSSGLVFESLLLFMQDDKENRGFWEKAIKDNFSVMKELLKNGFLKEVSSIRFENGGIKEYDTYNKFSPIINGVNYSYIPSAMSLYKYDQQHGFNLLSEDSYKEFFALLDKHSTPYNKFFLSPSTEQVNMLFYLGNKDNMGQKMKLPDTSTIISGDKEIRLFESLRFSYNKLLLGGESLSEKEINFPSSDDFYFKYRSDLFRSFSENIKAISSLLGNESPDLHDLAINFHELLYNFSRFDKGLCKELMNSFKDGKKLGSILEQLSKNGFMEFNANVNVSKKYEDIANKLISEMGTAEFKSIRENLELKLFMSISQADEVKASWTGSHPPGMLKAIIELSRDLDGVSETQMNSYGNDAVSRRLKLIVATGSPYYKIHPVVERSFFTARYPQDIQQLDSTISMLESGYSSLDRYLEYVQRLETVSVQLKEKGLMDNYFYVRTKYLEAVNNIAEEDMNTDQRESYLRTVIYLGINSLDDIKARLDKGGADNRFLQELYRNALVEVLRSYAILGKYDVVKSVLKDLVGYNLSDSNYHDKRDRLYEPYSFEKFSSHDNYMITDVSNKFMDSSHRGYMSQFLEGEERKLFLFDVLSNVRGCYQKGFYSNGLGEYSRNVIDLSNKEIGSLIETKARVPYGNIGTKAANLVPFVNLQENKAYDHDDFFKTVTDIALQESFALVDIGFSNSSRRADKNNDKVSPQDKLTTEQHEGNVRTYVGSLQKMIDQLNNILKDYNNAPDQSKPENRQPVKKEYRGAYSSLYGSAKNLFRKETIDAAKTAGREVYELFDDKALSRINERQYSFEVKLTLVKLYFAKLYLLRSTFGNTVETNTVLDELKTKINELENFGFNVQTEDSFYYIKKIQIDVRQLRIALRFEELAVKNVAKSEELELVVDKCFTDIDTLLNDKSISQTLSFRHEKNIRARFYQQVLDSLYRFLMDNPSSFSTNNLRKIEKIMQNLISDSVSDQHKDVWLRGYMQKLLYGLVSKLENVDKVANKKYIDELRGLISKVRSIGYMDGEVVKSTLDINVNNTNRSYFEQFHYEQSDQINKRTVENVPKVMENNVFLKTFFSNEIQTHSFFNEADVHLEYKDSKLGVLAVNSFSDEKSVFWTKFKETISEMDDTQAIAFVNDFKSIANAGKDNPPLYELRKSLFNGNHSLDDQVNVKARVNMMKILLSIDRASVVKQVFASIFNIVPIGKKENESFSYSDQLSFYPISNYILDQDMVSEIYNIKNSIILSGQKPSVAALLYVGNDILQNIDGLLPSVTYSLPQNNTENSVLNSLSDAPSPYSFVSENIGLYDTPSVRYVNYIDSIPLPTAISSLTGSLEYDFNKQMVSCRNTIDLVLKYFGGVEKNGSYNIQFNESIKGIIQKINDSGLFADADRAVQLFGFDAYKMVLYVNYFKQKLSLDETVTANIISNVDVLNIDAKTLGKPTDEQLKAFKEFQLLNSLKGLTYDKILPLLKNETTRRDVLAFILRPDVLPNVSREMYVKLLQKNHYKDTNSTVQSGIDVSNPNNSIYELAQNNGIINQLNVLMSLDEVKGMNNEQLATTYLAAVLSKLSKISSFSGYISDNSIDVNKIDTRISQIQPPISSMSAYIYSPQIKEGRSRLAVEVGKKVFDYDNFNGDAKSKLYDDRVCFMPFMFEHNSYEDRGSFFRVAQIETQLLDLRLKVLSEKEEGKKNILYLETNKLIDEYNELIKKHSEFNRTPITRSK
jgi:hypothetical protein